MKEELEDNAVYYYFEGDGTMGYVIGAKAKRMIKGWGWKRKQFVDRNKIRALFGLQPLKTT